ncbi:MAG: DUF6785 family protein [Thermoproteota archaeon]
MKFGEKTASEKVEEVKEFKIKHSLIILLAVIVGLLSFIGTVEIALNGSVGSAFMCRYAWGSVSKTMGIPIMSVLLVLLAYPFKFLFGGKISIRTLILLYMIGLVTSYYGIGHYETFACWPPGFSRTLLYTPDEVRPQVEAWWWMPPYEVVKLITTGGVATDWAAWSGSIVFWTLYMLVFYLLGSSLMLLFRRRWIDIEMIPVPYVKLTHEVIGIVAGEPRTKKAINWFIIGLLAGFLYEFQVFMTYLFPWWPDILAWRGTPVDSTSPQGCVCLFPTHILSKTLVRVPHYSKNILPYAIYYMIPLEILFSTWFFYFLMMILEQIAYYFGYYTGIFELGSGCRMYGGGGPERSYTMGPPFYWMPMIMIGGNIGLALMILYQSRSYLVETVRFAVRSGKASAEAKEPLTYRNIYLLLLFSIIFMLAFFFLAGLSIGTAIVSLTITGFTTIISSAYIMGLIGAGFHEVGVELGWPLMLVWPTPPDIATTYTSDWVMGHVFYCTGINHLTHGVNTGAYATLQTQAMGTLAKLRLKDVFIFTTIATIIALIVAHSTRVWIVNLLGTGRVPIWGGCAVNQWCWISIDVAYKQLPPIGTQLSAGLVGFIIIMALHLLRTRFVWWPLHPIGFIMSTAPAIAHMREWNCFFGAWIAKYLTLRIGGSKAYEEYGIPIAGGLMAGYVLSNLVAYIVGTIKFFVAF